jgi:hypothetical protein
MMSDTLEYINLTEVDLGLVGLCGPPMHLVCTFSKRSVGSMFMCILNKKRREPGEWKCLNLRIENWELEGGMKKGYPC